MEDNAKIIINVAGDYVQSKYVEYEIGNVEPTGIGIQIVNSRKSATTAATVRVRTPKLQTATIAIGKKQQCQLVCFTNVYSTQNGLHQTPTQMISSPSSLEKILQHE